MGKYNVWNKWGKLKTVMLGNTYIPEYFDSIKDPDVKSGLKRVAEEMHEDLDYFDSVLKDFGCNVIRPEIDPKRRISDDMGDIIPKGERDERRGIIPRQPLFPRDHQFVLGDKLVYTGNERTREIRTALQQYNDTDKIGIEDKSLVDAPHYTVVGRDLYVDHKADDTSKVHVHTSKTVESVLLKSQPDLRINNLTIGGHNDACFHTVKEGAIFSLSKIQRYDNTFPNWDVLYLPDQSWEKVKGFLKIKSLTQGKWWIPGEENNDALTMFIETWLEDWVGYVEETVFDVNVLVLDEHHVCVNNMNPEVIAFLKKHKMEPIHVPWRHRFFTDGGLHCITLDLEREGEMVDYFPERKNKGIIDYGFD